MSKTFATITRYPAGRQRGVWAMKERGTRTEMPALPVQLDPSPARQNSGEDRNTR
jgi:hypothetical protein